MSRPLRANIRDGWYHVINRGIDRNDVFTDDRDREHFLEILGEARERYVLETHAFVLLGNHYHLLARTPEANLSAAMQWINQSYATWFNRKHDRVGPLYQGRFKSWPVEPGESVRRVAMYIHLNPVRIKRLGLGKDVTAASRPRPAPTREAVTERMRTLRFFAWSSYRCYAGYEKGPDWLERSMSRARKTRQSIADWQRAYRAEARRWIAEGVDEAFSERIREALAIGSESFRRQIAENADWGRESQKRRRRKRLRGWEEVVKTVEELSGEELKDLLVPRGQWARGALLWAARHACGMTLADIGRHAGNKDYAAIAMAIKRYENKLEERGAWKRLHNELAEVLNV